MKDSDKLTKELITHIRNSFGFANPPLFGKAGLSEDEFKTDSVFRIQTDQNVLESNIYSGRIIVENLNFQAAGILLKDDVNEFILTWKLNDYEDCFGLKQFENDDVGFLVKFVDNKIIPLTMKEKLFICGGVEEIVDLGLTWRPEPDFKNLSAVLKELVEM